MWCLDPESNRTLSLPPLESKPCQCWLAARLINQRGRRDTGATQKAAGTSEGEKAADLGFQEQMPLPHHASDNQPPGEKQNGNHQ